MPETIDGYELFQSCLGLNPEETISFAEIVNDLGDGYDASLLVGSDTGTRAWKLNFPYLAGGTSHATITYRNVTMTPEEYVWDLFCRSKRSGLPFAIQSARNEQYYLVKFADRSLSYQRLITKLYSSQLAVRQYRNGGATVFQPSQMRGIWGHYRADTYSGTYTWTDKSGLGHNLVSNGSAVAHPSAVQNGLAVFRLNSGGADAYFNIASSPTIYDALFVMKMREATFSNLGGILTASSSVGALNGNTGTTKFYNFGFGVQYEYRKNGVLYAESDQQAPMNTFGVVHIRFQGGITLPNLQIGKNANFAGTYANVDIGEVVLTSRLQNESDIAELVEALMTRWDIH